MNNATFVFEVLLRDSVFMGCLDNYIYNFSQNGSLDVKNVPQLVLSLMLLLQTKFLNKSKEALLKKNCWGRYKTSEFNLTVADTRLLLDLYSNYILEKISCTEKFVKDFTSTYNICVSLATLLRKV
jgi:hypothetical protein